MPAWEKEDGGAGAIAPFFLNLPLATTPECLTLYTYIRMATDNKNQLQIAVAPEVEDGVYSNLAVITHSSAEFILDFIRLLPNSGNPKVKSRIVMAPEHVKRLMYALNDNISKYEKAFGPIDLHTTVSGGSFSEPRGEA